MANLTTGIHLRSTAGTGAPLILLFSEFRRGVDTLVTVSGNLGGERSEKLLAQQGAYGSADAGWHFTKPDGTNVDFCTIADVLEYHGLEYME